MSQVAIPTSINQPQVSVIIPVFNVVDFLDDCLKSVTSQTFHNFEIVIINDGSSDASGDISEIWAKKDDRIRVIHKENEGLNSARRDGFLASSGKFITFIDSDDVIAHNYLEVLYSSVMADNVDISSSCFQQFKEVKKLNFTTDKAEIVIQKKKETLLSWFILGAPNPWGANIYMMTAWGKMYRRDVLDNIDWEYSNYRANEDELWTMQVLNNTKNGISVIHPGLYGYRINENSITQKKYFNEYDGRALNKFEFIGELYEKSYKYLGNEYRDQLLERLAKHILDFLKLYTNKNLISLQDILSARKVLYPKITEILKLSMSETAHRDLVFVKRYGIFVYVCRLKLISALSKKNN